MNALTQEEHYGATVWTNKETDALRKEECLCLNCGTGYCKAASRAFELCKQFDMAMMITRCKSFKPK